MYHSMISTLVFWLVDWTDDSSNCDWLLCSSLRDDADEDMKDIDIYFLSLNSKIPEILSAALSNYMVVATLRFNKDQQLSTLSTIDRLQHSYVLVFRVRNEIFQWVV